MFPRNYGSDFLKTLFMMALVMSLWAASPLQAETSLPNKSDDSKAQVQKAEEKGPQVQTVQGKINGTVQKDVDKKENQLIQEAMTAISEGATEY